MSEVQHVVAIESAGRAECLVLAVVVALLSSMLLQERGSRWPDLFNVAGVHVPECAVWTQ